MRSRGRRRRHRHPYRDAAQRTRRRSVHWPTPGDRRQRAIGPLAAPVALGGRFWLGKLALHWLKPPALSMFFLAAVLLCANRFGTGSGRLGRRFCPSSPIISSSSSRSTHSLSPARMSSWRSPSFSLVAIVTGGLSGRVREQSDAAGRRIFQTQMLFDFSRKLSATATLDDVLWAVASQTASARSRARRIVLLAEDGETCHQGRLSARRQRWGQRMDGGALGIQHARGRGARTDDAAQCPFRLPAAADVARRRWRDRRAGPVRNGFRRKTIASSRRCSIRRRSPSSARCWSAMRRAPRPLPKASVCARRCSPRSRMICARRSPSILGAVTSLRSLGAKMPKDSARRSARRRSRRRRAAVALRRQSPRHDAARNGAHRDQARLGRPRRRRARGRGACHEGSGRIGRLRST